MGVRYGDEDSNIECGLLDIGGYVMKIPFITFQFILFLSLEVHILQKQVHHIFLHVFELIIFYLIAREHLLLPKKFRF